MAWLPNPELGRLVARKGDWVLVERACPWASNPYPACGHNWYSVKARGHGPPDWSTVQYHKVRNEGEHRIGAAIPGWTHPDLRRNENV